MCQNTYFHKSICDIALVSCNYQPLCFDRNKQVWRGAGMILLQQYATALLRQSIALHCGPGSYDTDWLSQYANPWVSSVTGLSATLTQEHLRISLCARSHINQYPHPTCDLNQSFFISQAEWKCIVASRQWHHQIVTSAGVPELRPVSTRRNLELKNVSFCFWSLSSLPDHGGLQPN